ncbi:Oligoxyloglucan reducing end-specific cellobiohydrolase [Balamuthia mandrillaris]
MTTSSLLLATLLLSVAMPISHAAEQTVRVKNNLPVSSCANGNSLTLFLDFPNQQNVPRGEYYDHSGDFTNAPGIGIQINNWYWTQEELPVQEGNGDGVHQNPDNSGAQFMLSDDCELSYEDPWFGLGIQTWLVADVQAAIDPESGLCTVTISGNADTDSVTPDCCAPPLFESGVCDDETQTWGVTNNGRSWPPTGEDGTTDGTVDGDEDGTEDGTNDGDDGGDGNNDGDNDDGGSSARVHPFTMY